MTSIIIENGKWKIQVTLVCNSSAFENGCKSFSVKEHKQGRLSGISCGAMNLRLNLLEAQGYHTKMENKENNYWKEIIVNQKQKST